MNFKKQTVCTLLAMSVLTLASCNKDVIYKVTVPETNGLIVTPLEVKKGVDYAAKLTVNKDLTSAVLPTKIDKITSGNEEIVEDVYTYSLSADCLSADLLIPAKVITGDIDIRLQLVEKLSYDAAKQWVGEHYKETTQKKTKEILLEIEGSANTQAGKEAVKQLALEEYGITLNDDLKGSVKKTKEEDQIFSSPVNIDTFEEEFPIEYKDYWEFNLESNKLSGSITVEQKEIGMTTKGGKSTDEKGYVTSLREELTSSTMVQDDTISIAIITTFTY